LNREALNQMIGHREQRQKGFDRLRLGPSNSGIDPAGPITPPGEWPGQERTDLKNDQDDADPGHEARDSRL